MSEHPNTTAENYVRQVDEFTGLRKRISDEFYNCGGRNWIAKWLATKAIEDLIDAKIAAAIRTPSTGEEK